MHLLVRLPSLPAALARLLCFVVVALLGGAVSDDGFAGEARPVPVPSAVVRALGASDWADAWASLGEPEREEAAEGERDPGDDRPLLPAPTTPVRYAYLVQPAHHQVVPARAPVASADQIPACVVIRLASARGPPLLG